MQMFAQNLAYLATIGLLLISSVVYYFTKSNVLVAFTFFPLCLTLAAILSWSKGRLLPAASLFVFTFLILDFPSGRAFYDITPITEVLGSVLLLNFNKFSGISFLRFSLFELVSYIFLFWLTFKHMVKPAKSSPRETQIILVVALILPIVAIFSGFTGLIRGNDFGLLITQTRFLGLITAWTLIGYFLIDTAEDFKMFFYAIIFGILFKCLQAIYIFFADIGGTMGEREFLVEHMTSDFIATAAFFICALVALSRMKFSKKLLLLMPLIPMSAVYFLNDRRASLVGVGICILMLIYAMPRTFWIKYWRKLALLSTAGAAFIVATWKSEGAIGFIGRTIRDFLFSESATPTYRSIENYNLFQGVIDNPIFGWGFGMRFPIVMPMPDISVVYSDFDLIPHNTLVYLWAFGGTFAIAAISTLVAINLAAATRLFRLNSDIMIKVIGLVCFTISIRWLVYTYSDIGLLEQRILALMAFAAGGCWKLYFHTTRTTTQRHLNGGSRNVFTNPIG